MENISVLYLILTETSLWYVVSNERVKRRFRRCNFVRTLQIKSTLPLPFVFIYLPSICENGVRIDDCLTVYILSFRWLNTKRPAKTEKPKTKKKNENVKKREKPRKEKRVHRLDSDWPLACIVREYVFRSSPLCHIFYTRTKRRKCECTTKLHEQLVETDVYTQSTFVPFNVKRTDINSPIGLNKSTILL